jgi:hypothetical protein
MTRKRNNRMNTISLLSGALPILGFVMFTSCDRKKTEQYGDPVKIRTVTPLSTILKEPESFHEKTLTVEGKIVRQCPTGCWIDIQQGSALIHVDFNPSGFAIPQSLGKTILVEGQLRRQNGQTMLIGKGVELP